jgi:hypothetical protein
MIIKNLPTGEIKEVQFYDPYMSANTDASYIDIWSIVLFGLPLTLLLNDVFHFLPTQGPLEQLQQMFQ